MIEYLERLPTRFANDRHLARRDGVLVEVHTYLGHEQTWAFFAEKVEILRGITHPHLSPVIEVTTLEREPDRHLVITGLETGPSIETLSVPALCAGLAGVAEALAMLADRWGGYTYRRISPAWLFVHDDGNVRLRAPLFHLPVEQESTRGMRPDDLAWLAPEQIRGLPDTATTDVYALALLVYAHIAGGNAFVREGAFDTLLAIRDVTLPRATGVPDALADLLVEAMQRDPARRPDLRSFAKRLRHTGSRG